MPGGSFQQDIMLSMGLENEALLAGMKEGQSGVAKYLKEMQGKLDLSDDAISKLSAETGEKLGNLNQNTFQTLSKGLGDIGGDFLQTGDMGGAFTQGMDSMKGAAGGLTGKLTSMLPAIGASTAGIGLAVIAIAALFMAFKKVIAMGMEFEESLADIAQQTGMNVKQQRETRTQILQTSQAYGVALKQVASIAHFAATSSKQAQANIEDFMAATINLQRTTRGSQDDVQQLIGVTTRAFKLEGEELVKFNFAITETGKRGAASVAHMTSIMGDAAELSAKFGMEGKELALDIASISGEIEKYSKVQGSSKDFTSALLDEGSALGAMFRASDKDLTKTIARMREMAMRVKGNGLAFEQLQKSWGTSAAFLDSLTNKNFNLDESLKATQESYGKNADEIRKAGKGAQTFQSMLSELMVQLEPMLSEIGVRILEIAKKHLPDFIVSVKKMMTTLLPVVDFIFDNFDEIWDFIKAINPAFTMLWGSIQFGFGILQLLTGDWRGALDSMGAGLDNFLHPILYLPKLFLRVGEKMITAFGDGMMGAWPAVSGWFTDKLDYLRSFLPFSDAKRGPLSDLTKSGERLFGTMADGMQKGASGLVSMFSKTISGSLDMGVGWIKGFVADAMSFVPGWVDNVSSTVGDLRAWSGASSAPASSAPKGRASTPGPSTGDLITSNTDRVVSELRLVQSLLAQIRDGSRPVGGNAPGSPSAQMAVSGRF